MTAEIAVMNKEAVALAADSAVTVQHGTGQKIFTSANKIFSLSKYHPVGIMVFGDAQFMEIPLETIIKIYRQRLSTTNYPMLKEHAENFVRFLDSNDPTLFPEAQQEKHVASTVHSYFEIIRDEIRESVARAISERGEVPETEVQQIASTVVDEKHQTLAGAPALPTIPDNHASQILDKYRAVIERVRSEIFENLPFDPERLEKLSQIASTLFTRFPADVSESVAGIVVAGFGQNDIFPALYSFDLSGIAAGRLKYREGTKRVVTHDMGSVLIPFAQGEMIRTFMEGVDPAYSRVISSAMSGIANRMASAILDRLDELTPERKEEVRRLVAEESATHLREENDKLREYRRENFWLPIIRIVGMLPKDELATLAESLVTLTSLKRKVSPQQETVGGPVDVAVISKGDGFVWIKRKHYFRPELNPQFLANYNREWGKELQEGGSEEGASV